MTSRRPFALAALAFPAVALLSITAMGANYGAHQDQPSRVQLSADGVSWVRVHDSAGTPIFTRELQPGDVYRVPDRPGLTLDTGNATALSLAVDGGDARPLASADHRVVQHNLSLDPGQLGRQEALTAPPAAAASPVAETAPPAQQPSPATQATAQEPSPAQAPIQQAIAPQASTPQASTQAEPDPTPITAAPMPAAASVIASAEPAIVPVAFAEAPAEPDPAPITAAPMPAAAHAIAPTRPAIVPVAFAEAVAPEAAPPAPEPVRPARQPVVESTSGISERPVRSQMAVAPEAGAIQLEMGKGTVVHLRAPAATVFVSNPAVADVQVKSPTLIYIQAKAPGETSLYAADDADHVLLQAPINVTHNLSRLRAALAEMLPDEPIRVESIEGSIVLSGNVSSAAHAEDARQLAALFASNAGESPGGQGGSPSGGAQGAPAAQAGAAGGAGGQAAAPSAGGGIINRLSVIAPNQVNLRVRVAEVARNTLKELGINWNHAGSLFNFSTNNPVLLPNQFEQNDLKIGIPLGAGSRLSAELDAMAQEGLITTLAEPNLTAMSGQSANFLAGGEFPIPVAATATNGIPTITIEFKKYGVSVDFLPTVLDDNRVNLRLKSEVSELTQQGAIQQGGITIPAIKVRRTETSVELASGDSFVIAGLLQNNGEHDISKLPALGDLPILGPLFRSDRFQRQETELVIIVTPYLVRPSAVAAASPADGLNRPNDLNRFMTGNPYRQGLANQGGAARAQDGRGLVGPAGFQLN